MKQKILATSLIGILTANIAFADYTLPPAKEGIGNYLQTVLLTPDGKPTSTQTIKAYGTSGDIIVGSNSNAVFIKGSGTGMVGIGKNPSYPLDINGIFSPSEKGIKFFDNITDSTRTLNAIIKTLGNLLYIGAKNLAFSSNDFVLNILGNKIFETNSLESNMTNLTIGGENILTVHGDVNIQKGAFKDATIEEADLADNAIANVDINDNAVTHDKIADDAVSTDKLAPGAIQTEDIQNRAVDASKIKPGSIENRNIGPDAITYNKIADHTINSNNVNKSQVQVRGGNTCIAPNIIPSPSNPNPSNPNPSNPNPSNPNPSNPNPSNPNPSNPSPSNPSPISSTPIKTMGICGDSNGKSFDKIPTENLCADGSKPNVSMLNTNQAIWTCNGKNGGNDKNCGATINAKSNWLPTPISEHRCMKQAKNMLLSTNDKKLDPNLMIRAKAGDKTATPTLVKFSINDNEEGKKAYLNLIALLNNNIEDGQIKNGVILALGQGNNRNKGQTEIGWDIVLYSEISPVESRVLATLPIIDQIYECPL